VKGAPRQLPFSKVLKVWLQTKDDKRRLQHRQPFLDRLVLNSNVVAERTVVDDLPNPSCQQRQKFLEQRDVLQPDQLTNVMLDIGLKVVGVSNDWTLRFVVHPRQETAKKGTHQSAPLPPCARKLGDREQIQGQDAVRPASDCATAARSSS
jgi:hypothetical protein